MRKKIKDHLGNGYLTKQVMCDAYEVKLSVFNGRIKIGWTLEEALCGKKVIDHLGNEYSSKQEMCDVYGVTVNAFDQRINYGWTLEEALCGKVVDHLGNRYFSKQSMCNAYDITTSIFDRRIKKGWTLEEVLCGKKEEMFYDHLGNAYPTQQEMCQAYNINTCTFTGRIENGWDLKSALTKPVRKKSKACKDHLGNEFPSIKEMCDFYKISYLTFNSRLYQGYSLEEALTKSISNIAKECEDHRGNEFSSIKEMCNFYKISYHVYKWRISCGWTKEEALTIPKNMYLGQKRVIDILNKKNILYFHDVTFGYVLETLGLGIDYDEFIREFQITINKETNYNWSIERIKRLRPDFVLYRDDVTAITGVIEFDGVHHQNFIEYFFKTIEKFLERNEADYVKNNLWECLNIPMLRIRDDQINLIDKMVDDFLIHSENYITTHDTYLTEKEYKTILQDTIHIFQKKNTGSH